MTKGAVIAFDTSIFVAHRGRKVEIPSLTEDFLILAIVYAVVGFCMALLYV